jgi:hypothetical protein
MKFFLSLLFLLMWQISFSQMTFAEMKNIQKMDLSKFETYCLSRGYEFSETTDDDDVFGIDYVKGNGINTKHIIFYERYLELKNVVVYQLGSSSEYLLLKSQIESAGLKLIKTFSYQGKLFKDYSGANYIVNIVTYKDSELNKDFHEITLKSKN